MARVSIRYRKDVPGLGKIMTGRGMESMLRGHAERGKEIAEHIAPVDTGEYRSAFRVSSATRGTGRWADRANAYLHNDSDHALLVEYVNDERVLGTVAGLIEDSPW